MARRKQLKGVAGNLAQWCLSKNFDYHGYWAVGKLYAYPEANNTSQFVITLVDNYVPNDGAGKKFSDAVMLMSEVFHRDLNSNRIPDWWVKDAQVIFQFNCEYQEKYHFWSSALGGKPAICLVIVSTDHGKTYTIETGCNVWVHNPKREQRRYGF